ncbi:MAG: protein-glutamate O-methyltransferase CheR [Bacteroidia bacterium]|nr:protein-glutamate O-methyltransferase CheR [Bacteroidia bacterium]
MKELETIELSLFLEAVFRYSGYDFRGYAPSYIRRRVLDFMKEESATTISCLQDKVLHQKDCFHRFLDFITIGVTEMFRDTSFFKTLREKFLPVLKNNSFNRIWVAACSTGEEVFSIAIALHEESLLDTCKMYATDINETSLEKAKAGIFPLASMKKFTENYVASGGERSFSQYFTAKYENAMFSKKIHKNITWSRHNLLSDASFNEFQLILCRNVLIYFTKDTQAQVHKLLFESLADNGILALGAKESIALTPFEKNYKTLDADNKLYQKI